MALVVIGELGAIIESDTTTHRAGQRTEEFGECFHYRISRLARLTTDTEQARASLMSHQNGLTVLGKQHQVSFPVTWLSALVDVGRALLDGDSSLDMINGTAALRSAPATFAFAAGQVVPPAEVVGAPDLSIDEPVDRLIADDLAFAFLFESTGHLGRRPALHEPGENLLLQIGIAQQSTAFPAPALGLLICIGRLVAYLRALVAFELTHYSRWRAIHSCRDLADCFPGLAKSGKGAAFFKRKLFIVLSHSNTLPHKCCTWFVNLGNPSSDLAFKKYRLDTGVRRYDVNETLAFLRYCSIAHANSMMMLPKRSICAVCPGCTTVVESICSMIAGPLSRFPEWSLSRSYTGVSCQPS